MDGPTQLERGADVRAPVRPADGRSDPSAHHDVQRSRAAAAPHEQTVATGGAAQRVPGKAGHGYQRQVIAAIRPDYARRARSAVRTEDNEAAVAIEHMSHGNHAR